MYGAGWGWALPMVLGGAITGLMTLAGNLVNSWFNSRNQARTTSGNVASSNADTVFARLESYNTTLSKENTELRNERKVWQESARHVWELEEMVKEFENHMKECHVP